MFCRPTGNGIAKEAQGGSDTDTDDEETVAQRKQQQEQQEAEAVKAAAAAAAPKPPAAAAPKKRPAGMVAFYHSVFQGAEQAQNMASLVALPSYLAICPSRMPQRPYNKCLHNIMPPFPPFGLLQLHHAPCCSCFQETPWW